MAGTTKRYTPDGQLLDVLLAEARKPRPTTYSKMRCVAELTRLGVWEQVKAWIEEHGLYDLYLAAQDFSEDNEYFQQGKAALQQALGLTDAQVAEILAKCVAD